MKNPNGGASAISARKKGIGYMSVGYAKRHSRPEVARKFDESHQKLQNPTS